MVRHVVYKSVIFFAITHIMKKKSPLDSVDWESQWAAHGLGYQNGFVHLNVLDYAPDALSAVLRLKPGPGFGDLSHPTTRLVLRLMNNRMQKATVLDVGCGSGVLSLAALAMGASTVCGIDIEAEALVHAESNCLLNGMQKQAIFVKPQECDRIFAKKNSVIMLMNMIQSEQAVAWESLDKIHKHMELAITSGVMVEERASYLMRCSQWGWQLVEEREEDGWLGFVFRLSGK